MCFLQQTGSLAGSVGRTCALDLGLDKEPTSKHNPNTPHSMAYSSAGKRNEVLKHGWTLETCEVKYARRKRQINTMWFQLVEYLAETRAPGQKTGWRLPGGAGRGVIVQWVQDLCWGNRTFLEIASGGGCTTLSKQWMPLCCAHHYVIYIFYYGKKWDISKLSLNSDVLEHHIRRAHERRGSPCGSQRTCWNESPRYRKDREAQARQVGDCGPSPVGEVFSLAFAVYQYNT